MTTPYLPITPAGKKSLDKVQQQMDRETPSGNSVPGTEQDVLRVLRDSWDTQDAPKALEKLKRLERTDPGITETARVMLEGPDLKSHPLAKTLGPAKTTDWPIEDRDLQAAHLQMSKNGITEAQQRKGYIPRVSEALYRNITPYFYSGHEKDIVPTIKDVLIGSDAEAPLNRVAPRRGDEDAWRMYLGLPQKYGSFAVSPFRPTNSKDPKAVYYRLGSVESQIKSYIPNILKSMDKDGKNTYESGGNSTLNYYQISRGKDEKGNYLAYYDVWDLTPGASNYNYQNNPSRAIAAKMIDALPSKIGAPFEVYNRIYYDPKTMKPIRPKRTQ